MRDEVQNIIIRWKRGLFSRLDCWYSMYQLDEHGLLKATDWSAFVDIVGALTVNG